MKWKINNFNIDINYIFLYFYIDNNIILRWKITLKINIIKINIKIKKKILFNMFTYIC